METNRETERGDWRTRGRTRSMKVNTRSPRRRRRVSRVHDTTRPIVGSRVEKLRVRVALWLARFCRRWLESTLKAVPQALRRDARNIAPALDGTHSVPPYRCPNIPVAFPRLFYLPFPPPASPPRMRLVFMPSFCRFPNRRDAFQRT